MDQSLTIIKNTNSLVHYSITRIPPDVLDLLERCFKAVNNSAASKCANLLKMLDAFCHVTGFQITYMVLSSHSFRIAGMAFMRAVQEGSVCSIGPRTRYSCLLTFIKMMDNVRKEVPLLPSFEMADADSRYAHVAWEQMKQNLDAKALKYWNGWEVQGRKGKSSFLPIPCIWNSHGEDFAVLIYERYKQHVEKQLGPAHSDFNLFLQFLSRHPERWPVSSFQHPIEIKRLFISNMLFNFHQALEFGSDIKNRTRSYSAFIHTMEEAFVEPKIWARPFAGQLPRPMSMSAPGFATNLKKNKDGTVVKVKLITDVPLHITDKEAIDLLFKKIRTDNKLVLDWARSRLCIADQQNAECQALAKLGKIITGGNHHAKKVSEIGIENLCATYQQKGMAYLQTFKEEVTGKVLSSEIVECLGVPTVDTFFAFQMLLTHAHPCITESFFTYFELYDKRGNLSGFLETNSGYQLVGYKDRKGGALSEQKIDLTPEQADWVKLIISLTTPYRNELRAAEDDTWRYLFLHSAGRLVAPTRPEALRLTRKSSSCKQTMIKEFMRLGNLSEEVATRFVLRLSITAFRASAAVEVYLDTHSAEEMARSLGHTRYSSSLLSSYLPEAILAFFQSRWIRIFQRGIICRAMKDSPRLLEAARFHSMEELHEFLKNHALRDIPVNLQNPDYLKTPQSSYASTYSNDAEKADHVIVSIDDGVLTALLSLSAAVSSAKPDADLCSMAIYWSEFSEVVVRDIESGYNCELQEHLHVARQHANASYMKELIYATAS